MSYTAQVAFSEKLIYNKNYKSVTTVSRLFSFLVTRGDDMEQTFVLVSLLLLCMPLTSCAGGCHHHGPENCTFARREFSSSNRTFCSWSLINFTYVFGSVTENRTCASLLIGKEKGNITSRTSCSTEGREHCLRLEYKFKLNDSIDLSVSIKDDGADDVGSPLWMVSSGHGWNRATIPVNTTGSFNIVIIAKRRPGHMTVIDLMISTVYVRDISYTKAPCLPPSFPAVSTNPTSQTSTPPSPPPPTTKTMTTAGTKTNDSKSSPSDNTPCKPAGSAVPVATPGNDQDTRDGVQAVSVPPFYKAGFITACVIIVIIIVVIIALTCWRKKGCRYMCSLVAVAGPNSGNTSMEELQTSDMLRML